MTLQRLRLLVRSSLPEFAWLQLRQFHNVAYVTELLRARHPAADKANLVKQAEQIRYCLVQAREYFEAAQTVSLATQPNLLYYGTMSLALSEILFKQTGESSLDRAREQHRHHGLELRMQPRTKQINPPLDILARALVAAPTSSGKGGRMGTFELWHRSCREMPVAGKLTYSLDHGSLEEFRLLFFAPDERLPQIADQGMSLFECLSCIPTMMDYMLGLDFTVPIVRARCTARIKQNTPEVRIEFHPGRQEPFEQLCEMIKVRPCDYESIQWEQSHNSGILITRGTDHSFTLPHCSTISADEVRFWSKEMTLNEFGLFYVALFITGNYARYYPDHWLRDIERASTLALAIEQLVAIAVQRVPLLTLGELMGAYLIPRD